MGIARRRILLPSPGSSPLASEGLLPEGGGIQYEGYTADSEGMLGLMLLEDNFILGNQVVVRCFHG
jgi:hypothetical protein